MHKKKAGEGGWVLVLAGAGKVPWYKCCSLAPEFVCLVCLISHFYICALQLYSFHRDVHSENVFHANIRTKNIHFTTEVRFYVAYGVCGVRVASHINSGIKYAINKCSSKCFSVF